MDGRPAARTSGHHTCQKAQHSAIKVRASDAWMSNFMMCDPLSVMSELFAHQLRAWGLTASFTTAQPAPPRVPSSAGRTTVRDTSTSSPLPPSRCQ